MERRISKNRFTKIPKNNPKYDEPITLNKNAFDNFNIKSEVTDKNKPMIIINGKEKTHEN